MKKLCALLILLGCTALSVPAGVDPKASFVNGREHGGEPLAVDFPADLFMTNIGSRLDGAGMCVDTSVEMSARWAGLDDFKGFRDHFAQKEGGGNYPSGLDRQIKEWCALKQIPVPTYVQYQGDDPEPLLELADRTGRMACIAYGYSPRYGHAINHMVCVPKFGGQYAVVLDNNLIGGNSREQLFEWMPRAELVNRMKVQGGGGGRMVACKTWVFLWAAAGPPPAPHN